MTANNSKQTDKVAEAQLLCKETSPTLPVSSGFCGTFGKDSPAHDGGRERVFPIRGDKSPYLYSVESDGPCRALVVQWLPFLADFVTVAVFTGPRSVERATAWADERNPLRNRED